MSLELGGRTWGCPLFQEEQDVVCKSPHRECGKCFLPNKFPSSCAHLYILPSGQSSLSLQ